jgi:quinol monooxygenase YgiN
MTKLDLSNNINPKIFFFDIEPTLKEELKDVVRELIEKIEKEIPLLHKAIEVEFEKTEMHEQISHFLNVPLLLRLSILDLAILFNYFLKADNLTEKKLFARLISSQLYEYIQDNPEILGKKYRDFISKLNDPELMSELNELSKEFNSHKKKHEKFLKEIRNNISSHKDINGILQAKLIQNLDINDVSIAFLEITKSFAKYYKFEKKVLAKDKN